MPQKLQRFNNRNVHAQMNEATHTGWENATTESFFLNDGNTHKLNELNDFGLLRLRIEVAGKRSVPLNGRYLPP